MTVRLLPKRHCWYPTAQPSCPWGAAGTRSEGVSETGANAEGRAGSMALRVCWLQLQQWPFSGADAKQNCSSQGENKLLYGGLQTVNVAPMKRLQNAAKSHSPAFFAEHCERSVPSTALWLASGSSHSLLAIQEQPHAGCMCPAPAQCCWRADALGTASRCHGQGMPHAQPESWHGLHPVKGESNNKHAKHLNLRKGARVPTKRTGEESSQ